MRNTYHVEYERDESGMWVASVREIRGCHTQGRTVDEARRRIVEAIDAAGGNGAAAIADDVKLPAEATDAVAQYSRLRAIADEHEQQARLAARRAVRVLQGGRLKMSARDAGRVLGLSHQRVHQLATSETPKSRRTAARKR